MKVKKAIKRIAALGVGATMVGATLMGAMAADLADFPDMFIKDGQFDGLIVVGKNANSIDSIGAINVALGLQKAAVTKTMVCGDATASRTTVSGEQVQIEKTGDTLNIGDFLADVQTNALDDGDLPSILADGEYSESEGENDNDVTYTQELDLDNVGADSGEVVYEQDDSDAPDADVYLKLEKGVNVYTYTLEFDDAVEFDDTDSASVAEDLESTTLEFQGQKYTITDVEDDAGDIDKLTMMAGESVLWISQDQTVTKEIDGVEHTITMVDVSENEDKCGFEVDGSSIWIDLDETQTVSGVTLGVTEATAVHNKDYDADICKVFIGAAELVLEHGQEVEVGGDEIDGSMVTITSANGEWDSIEITYDPDDDIYLAAGDEWVDPVFGNFKIIMGGEVAVAEELTLDASSNEALFTFTNYDDEIVEIPYYMDDDGGGAGAQGDFYFGETDDIAAEADEGFYFETDICAPTGGDITDCAGAQFLVVSDNVAHVIELSSIDDPDNNDPEIDFDDITYGTSSDNNDYGNAGLDDCAGAAGAMACDFDLASDAGTITLTFDLVGAERITFSAVDDGTEIYTQYEGEIQFTDEDTITFIENTDEGVEETIVIDMDGDTDEEVVEIDAPTGFTYDAVDFSDSDSDTQMYSTVWGSIGTYDSEDQDDLTIMHPEEQLYVDVFIAEAGATSVEQEGAGEGCSVSEKLNPIPSTVNKFDTEVLSTYQTTNVISIGGPCANSLTSALLGNPEVCWEGFEEGKAMLSLFESGSNLAMTVSGGTGKDTKLVSTILQNYENYDLYGMEMEATTVSESGLKIGPVTAAPVVEETPVDEEVDTEME